MRVGLGSELVTASSTRLAALALIPSALAKEGANRGPVGKRGRRASRVLFGILALLLLLPELLATGSEHALEVRMPLHDLIALMASDTSMDDERFEHGQLPVRTA